MKLGKLKMPAKGKATEMSDRLSEMSMVEEGESDPMESEEMAMEDEASPEDMMEEEDVSELRDIPDEELLAELRRRGLSAKAAVASKKPSKDSEYL